MQVHRGLLTHLEGGAIGQQSQLLTVFLAGNRDQPILDDRVAEPVGARGAQNVGAALVVFNAQRHPNLASFGIGGYRHRLHLALNLAAGLLNPFEDGQLEFLAGRFTERIGARNVEPKRFAIDVNIAAGAKGDPEGPDGQRGLCACRHAILRQRRDNTQHLLFGQPFGGELKAKGAGIIGLAPNGTAVWQTDLNVTAGQRGAVLIFGHRFSRDGLAPEVNGARQFDLQADLLELVLLDLKPAAEITLAGPV